MSPRPAPTHPIPVGGMLLEETQHLASKDSNLSPQGVKLSLDLIFASCFNHLVKKAD